MKIEKGRLETAPLSSTPIPAQAAAATPAPPVRVRVDSIDALRGIVMILMALDHTRGFFSEVKFYPLDLSQTWPALFLTRWITHFCAPVFILLAGVGASLSRGMGKSRTELAEFLLTRGLWLAFLELTWVRCFGWMFNFDYHFVGVGVLWAIGWSMVVLSGLIFLPSRWIVLFGLILVTTHNLFDGIGPAQVGRWRWLWSILHQPDGLHPAPGYLFAIGYPLIPWMGVMALGYGLGSWYFLDPAVRRRRLLLTGLTAIGLFLILRGFNIYGDPGPWVPQKNWLFNLFAMMHCQKYPPSLLYLLMTLGPALIVLAILDRKVPNWLRPVQVFGRVPLFFYLLHLPLLHGMAVLFALAQYGSAAWLFANPGSPSKAPANYGYGLLIVYLVWIVAVGLLFLPSAWFDRIKRQRRRGWVSYL